jgi:hypothetical protein
MSPFETQSLKPLVPDSDSEESVCRCYCLPSTVYRLPPTYRSVRSRTVTSLLQSYLPMGSVHETMKNEGFMKSSQVSQSIYIQIHVISVSIHVTRLGLIPHAHLGRQVVLAVLCQLPIYLGPK